MYAQVWIYIFASLVSCTLILWLIFKKECKDMLPDHHPKTLLTCFWYLFSVLANGKKII